MYDMNAVEAAFMAKINEVAALRADYENAMSTIQLKEREIDELRERLDARATSSARATARTAPGRRPVADDGYNTYDDDKYDAGFSKLVETYGHLAREGNNVFMSDGKGRVLAIGTEATAQAGAAASAVSNGGFNNAGRAIETIQFGSRNRGTPMLTKTASRVEEVYDTVPTRDVMITPAAWPIQQRRFIKDGKTVPYWYLDPLVKPEVAIEYARMNKTDPRVVEWAARKGVAL